MLFRSLPPHPRTCRTCPTLVPSTARYAILCPRCRLTRRGRRPVRWVLTPERREVLLTRYYRDGRCHAAAIARAFGWPGHAVRHAAALLGIVQPRADRSWSSADLAYLEEHAGEVHVTTLARRLHRTPSAVVLKLRRLGIRRRVEAGYTARQLEDGLGVDHRTVAAWVARGWLPGHRRNPDAPPEERVPFQFPEAAVREFLREHGARVLRPHRVDLEFLLSVALPRRG